jgi:hypothetical protein
MLDDNVGTPSSLIFNGRPAPPERLASVDDAGFWFRQWGVPSTANPKRVRYWPGYDLSAVNAARVFLRLVVNTKSAVSNKHARRLARWHLSVRKADDISRCFRHQTKPLTRFGFSAERVHIVALTNHNRVPHFFGNGSNVLDDPVAMGAVTMAHCVMGQTNSGVPPNRSVDMFKADSRANQPTVLLPQREP